MNRVAATSPLAARTPPRLGVLSNPHSGRNRRALPRVRAMLETLPRVRHVVTDSGEAIPEALARMAADGVDVLAVNGGDGSVAQVLTVLMGPRSPFSHAPLLCALPGGTTNVTVGDVGVRGALETAVLRLLAWMHGRRADAEVLERPVIGVRSASGRLEGCGLVFGAGAIVDGIEYWHEAVRARGMRSELSSGVAMTRTVWGMLRGHPDFARPLRIRIRGDGALALDAELMLLVVCALERLFLGIHPFWGSGEGSLHCTAIERGARRFARALPSLLRGAPAGFVGPAAGYHSARVSGIELHFDGGYTLDGELHHASPGDAPLRLFDAGRVRFLRL